MKDPILAVITILLADSGVAGKVGTRVYRGMFPPDPTYPAIAVSRVDKPKGETTSSSKQATARIQCTTATKTTEVAGVETPGDAEAEIISDLILQALEDQQNTLVSGVYIVDIDDAGAVPDNSDGLSLKIWRDNHDFMINYQR